MKPRHHIIIGAGISGLALGWFLKSHFTDDSLLTILEADVHPGGWIQTTCDGGFLFEQGPRSCRSKGNGLATLQLIEALGIDDEVISASSEAQKRFIYLDGKLQTVPYSLFSFLRSPFMQGMLPSLWKEWQLPRSSLEDESIANFFERRLNREIAERLIDPLVSGIYAGDIDKLSLRSCFPQLHQLEQEYGSLVKGMFRKRKKADPVSPFIEKQRSSPIFSFKKGMKTLVDTLYSQLKDHVSFASTVKAITFEKEAVTVTLREGKKLKADCVFLATSALAAAEILQEVDPDSAAAMKRSSYATVAVVNMGWNSKVLKQEGFGYLVPTSQKKKILGVVFDSSVFPEQNERMDQTRLTTMIGGMHQPEVENFSKEELKIIAQEALNQQLGIDIPPDALQVSLAKQAIPQYEVGHEAKFQTMEKSLKKVSDSRLYLLGSAWRGVAVNDCIAEAKKWQKRYI